MGIGTREKLVQTTLELMRLNEPNNISIRQVADRTGIQPSVIYHYFPDKEALLLAAFKNAQMAIRADLLTLPSVTDPTALLRQRLTFHFDNAQYIVPMLRYFMAFKHLKPGEPGGFIPEQAYIHIRLAIDFGMKAGAFLTPDSAKDARVIVHALNGFVIEHFPISKDRREELIDSILPFILRALTNGKESGIQQVASVRS